MVSSEHSRLVRACYEKAKTILRQRYDEEFHAILAEQYEQAGLEINKRTSRMAVRRAATTEQEGQ